MKIIVNEEFSGSRLDVVVTSVLAITRAKAQKIIDDFALVNGKEAKSSLKVYLGDEIELREFEETPAHVIKQEMPLNIVYEDDDVIVINKARGMVCHPAAGHSSSTLINALAFHCDLDERFKDDVVRPGLVHRIDQDTSGLLVVAKNSDALAFLGDQLKDKTMNREYLALVTGIVSNDSLKVIAPIGRDKHFREKMCVDIANGKDAITHFRVIKRFAKATLIKCILETGRTHQIRVHLMYAGFPIVGDKQYNKKSYSDFTSGQLLHAYKLTFIHPTTKKRMTFYAPLDKYYQSGLMHFAQYR